MKVITAFSLCFFVLFGQNAFCQGSNMNLQGVWDGITNYHSGVKYNDVWGYEDGAGNEYAILGSVDSIIVIDVTNCANPTYVDAHLSGNTTVWRDMKTYSTYMYAVCECSDGLLTFDMSNIATSGLSLVSTTTTPFTSAHNIFIDELNAKLYAFGSNSQGGESAAVFDLSTPSSPSLLGNVRLDMIEGTTTDNFYIHDGYVRDDTLYASHGHNSLQELIVWDFDSPTAPTLIKRIVTGNYQHSSWLSDDGLYSYYAEEVPDGLAMGIVDLTNLNDGSGTGGLSIASTFSHSLETAGGTSTPHNPFVLNGKLYVSNYTDGVKVFDITNPTNPVIFAYWDTYPDNNGSPYPTGGGAYEGNWGVYPYLSSGCLLASDMEYGLHTFIVGVPAPVNWNKFEARNINDKKVQLTFSTISEENNDFFEIQKSYNGMDYEYLADIKGGGTTEELNEYTYLDVDLQPGRIYYRIKQIDYDGNFDYSGVRTVNIQGDEYVNVYPNPVVGEEFNLSFLSSYGKSYNVSVFDLTGRLIQEDVFNYNTVDTKKDFTFMFRGSVPSGTYFIKVSDANGLLLVKQVSKI